MAALRLTITQLICRVFGLLAQEVRHTDVDQHLERAAHLAARQQADHVA
jgi:hypothetical protein